MQDSIPQNNDSAIDNRALFPILPGRDSDPPFAEPPNPFEKLEPPGDEFVKSNANTRSLAAAKAGEKPAGTADHSPTSIKSENSTSYTGTEAMNNQSSQVVLASSLATTSNDALLNQDYDPFADEPASNNPPADVPPKNDLGDEVQEPAEDQPKPDQPVQDPAFDPFNDSEQKPEKSELKDSNDFQPTPSTDPAKAESDPAKMESDPPAQDSSNGDPDKTTTETDSSVLPQPSQTTTESVSVAPKAVPDKQSNLAEWEPLLRWLIPLLLLLLVAGLAWFFLRGRNRRSSRSSDDSSESPPKKKGFVKRNKSETLMDSGLVDETPKSGFASAELDSYLEPYDAKPAKRQQADDDSEFQFLEDDEIPPTKLSTPSAVSQQEQDDDDFDFSDFDEPEPMGIKKEAIREDMTDIPIRSGVSEDDDSIEFDDSIDLMETDEIEVETEVENVKQSHKGMEVASQLVAGDMEERESLTIEGEAREIFERPALKESSEGDRKKSFLSRLMHKGETADLSFEDSTPTISSTDLDQFEIVEENLGQLFDGYKPAQLQSDGETFGKPALTSSPQVATHGSVSDLQRSIAVLQDENSKLLARLNAAEAELDSFSQQQIQQLRELSLEQKNHLADLDRNRSEIVAAREEQERLLMENSELKTELKNLRDNSEAVNAVSDSEPSNETLANQLNESMAARDAIGSELNDVRAENNRLASILEEQRIALDATADLSARIEELQRQLGQAQQARNESENDWRERHSSIENALEHEKSERQILLNRIEEQQLAISSSNQQASHLSDLENQIARSNEENDVLKQKLATLEHEIRKSPESSSGADKSALDQDVKVKFTKLYNSFQKERKLRMESNDQLDQAEQQIASMRKVIKSLQEKLQ